jgi:hypothetical protein
MTSLGPIMRRIGLLLGTGYILYFYSEAVFWSQLRPDEGLQDRPLSCLLYSYLGYLTLVLMRHFRVHDAWGLLLVGAAFGWIGEGVFAMTLFGHPSMPFPFTISWTALAWHGPISVVLGWHLMGMALRRPGLGTVVGLSLVVGAFWGLWAYGWRFDSPPVAAGAFEFLLQAGAATALLALAYAAVAAGRPAEFRPSRPGLVVALLVLLAFSGLVTVPHVPMALALLPLLALLLWLLLRRHMHRHRGVAAPTILARHAAPLRPRNLAGLALMPVAATAVYAALGAAALPLHTLPVLGVAATVAGAVLFGIATLQTLRRSNAT